MYSPELLEHFRNPRNTGDLPHPALTVDVVNPACGDTLRLSVLWGQDGRILQAAYRIRGCTASIAAGSALTELLIGRTVTEAAALHSAEIEDALGGPLAAESNHATALCVDAVRASVRLHMIAR